MLTKNSLTKTITFIGKGLLVLLCMISLHGCKALLDNFGISNDTIYPAIYPVDNPAPPKSHGSIYQAGHEVSLYDDRIAARVGDVLTIKLEEMTQGQKKTKTKTSKITTNTMPTPTLFGGEVRSLDFLTNNDLEFDGEGDANEQNKLNGTISVTVVRVLSNGSLVIQGESWLTINEGREYVRLSGIVRREDIDPNNSVSSTRVANARISFSGNGQLLDTARGGFLTQLLNKFFPY